MPKFKTFRQYDWMILNKMTIKGTSALEEVISFIDEYDYKRSIFIKSDFIKDLLENITILSQYELEYVRLKYV